QQPTANSQQPTANSQQPTANSQQPTCKNFKLFKKSYIYKVVKILGYFNLSPNQNSQNNKSYIRMRLLFNKFKIF
ncbi:hypothetical protein, partial [uncultured Brachyspira sp.]|uniref:hypothetical protein n=1 Tax=uncultured Brachyspira sp. TaxID=221953 RepID=UPI0025833B56